MASAPPEGLAAARRVPDELNIINHLLWRAPVFSAAMQERMLLA